VRSDARSQVRHRWFVAKLAAQGLASSVELAALAANAARPCIAPKRVDHGAADSPLRERLELDPALLIEPVSRVDPPEDAVLNEVPDVDRVRHRRRHPAGERLDERQTRHDPAILMSGNGLGAHLISLAGLSGGCSISQLEYQQPSLCSALHH